MERTHLLLFESARTHSDGKVVGTRAEGKDSCIMYCMYGLSDASAYMTGLTEFRVRVRVLKATVRSRSVNLHGRVSCAGYLLLRQDCMHGGFDWISPHQSSN